MDLLIHFHGAGYVPRHGGYESGRPFIVAVVNLGSGSAVYENEFRDASTFPRLIETIRACVSERAATEIEISGIYLSSFSAGYGAVRAILKNHPSMPDGIVLLDGLHTDYVPSGRVLAQGGALNAEKLKGFLDYARLAVAGEKRFLITHSEIFPGTYPCRSRQQVRTLPFPPKGCMRLWRVRHDQGPPSVPAPAPASAASGRRTLPGKIRGRVF
jgi:hypothetical protein